MSSTPEKTTKEVINNITLTASPTLYPQAANESKSEILINPQPLKLVVDTPTDWPTVIATGLIGIGSIVTSGILARITYINQKSQIRAGTASFRQKWLEELRETTSEFLATAANIKLETLYDTDYFRSEKSNGEYSKLIRLQSKIELMLDKKQSYSQKVEDYLDAIVESLENDRHKFDENLNKLHNIMRDILEKAWTDIKNDLKGKGDNE